MHYERDVRNEVKIFLNRYKELISQKLLRKQSFITRVNYSTLEKRALRRWRNGTLRNKSYRTVIDYRQARKRSIDLF